MWAIHNIRIDQEERFDEMEWSSILGGAFHNPQMAKKLAEDKEFRKEHDGESDVIKAKVVETVKKRSRPEEDPKMREKILDRYAQADDAVMGLSDIIENQREE